ncbi:MAG: peptidoglycan-binding domain-containing protein [Pseudomonadota bacterium]
MIMTNANGSNTGSQDEPVELPHYRVIQLEWDAVRGRAHNEGVADFEELVTHHPEDNQNATLRNGIVVDGEAGRRHAVIGGEIQEIEVPRPGQTYGLTPDQVLLKKDFMLEDSRIVSGGRGVRDVDVPSPVAGHIGRVDSGQGLVDIHDREGGEVIARIRHMRGIRVEVGDTIEYGQAVGTQSNVMTGGKHVHLEMDTRYYQQYENYISDLTSGRLAIDPDRRTQGIEPLPVVDDGTFRIGESNDRVRDLQRVLADEGYRGRGNQPVAQDGVYRLDMQPAVLAFQRDHNLPETGDIDRATLALAPQPARREPDRADHIDRRFGPGVPAAPGEYGPPPHEHPQRVPGRAGGAGGADNDGQERAPDRQGPPQRHGAVLLDNPSHENHAMYATLLRTVNERDAQLGREPDEVSRQLAGGLTEQARARGLNTIGNASFTPDGTKVGMTDTKDLEAPWAKTAVGDVGQLAGQSLVRSSEHIAAINQQQTLEQSQKPPTQTQSMTGPEDQAPKAPRMA